MYNRYIQNTYKGRVPGRQKLTGEKHSIWIVDNYTKGEIWEHNAISVIKDTDERNGETQLTTGIMTLGGLKQKKETDLPDLKARCPETIARSSLL